MSLPGAFREVPRTGVIYVMTEAKAAGYDPRDPGWTNFGQGQPEVGELPGAPARMSTVNVEIDDHEYAPVDGLWELKEAVASHYNAMYRRGMPGQYSAENVCISAGGRVALTRAAASLGEINLGHFLPDYTAYEELLGLFRLFSPIPILLDPGDGYAFSLENLKREVMGRGLGALLLSNPCNPTGKSIHGDELAGWVDVARRYDCSLLLDEFYSHYHWVEDSPSSVTAARFVENVDEDPVVIVNGLTKNWRYPGWRVSWTVGPKSTIARLTSAGSFLDGGGPRPLQRAAISLLDTEVAAQEITAIRETFLQKRRAMIAALRSMGIKIELEPEGTFYVWGSVEDLPDGLNTGMDFFRRGLEHQFIVVPGEFFDVNPGGRRHQGRFDRHVRFSFGPSWEVLEQGLERMKAMLSGT